MGSTYFLHFFHFASSLPITFVNALALYIIGKNPKMRTPQHIYRINLAIADLMLGFSVFIPTIYFATERFDKTAAVSSKNVSLADQNSMTSQNVGGFVSFIGFVSWLFLAVSMCTLVAASFDRVVATVLPSRYVQRDKPYVTMGVCVFVWVVVVGTLIEGLVNPTYVLTSPFFVVSDERLFRIQSVAFSLVLLVLMLANSSIVMLVLYLHNRFVCKP